MGLFIRKLENEDNMSDNIRKPQEEIYNAPPNTNVEFDDFPFEDLEIRDLFWITNNPNDTFVKKVKQVKQSGWGSSTNFHLAIDKILEVIF